MDCHMHVFEPLRFARAPVAWSLLSPAATCTPGMKAPVRMGSR
ncbi:MAG: hypothetical protein ACKOXU_07140 [Limnohabitans sp.]